MKTASHRSVCPYSALSRRGFLTAAAGAALAVIPALRSQDAPASRKTGSTQAIELARNFDVPILFHFQQLLPDGGVRADADIKDFYRFVERYPTVKFIGHANDWWGAIDKNLYHQVRLPAERSGDAGRRDGSEDICGERPKAAEVENRVTDDPLVAA